MGGCDWRWCVLRDKGLGMRFEGGEWCKSHTHSQFSTLSLIPQTPSQQQNLLRAPNKQPSATNTHDQTNHLHTGTESTGQTSNQHPHSVMNISKHVRGTGNEEQEVREGEEISRRVVALSYQVTHATGPLRRMFPTNRTRR
jgi:hypothetical protein